MAPSQAPVLCAGAIPPQEGDNCRADLLRHLGVRIMPRALDHEQFPMQPLGEPDGLRLGCVKSGSFVPKMTRVGAFTPSIRASHSAFDAASIPFSASKRPGSRRFALSAPR